MCQSRLGALQQKAPLFDHLVGGHLHDKWHRKAECLGRFEIDHQLEFCWLHHGQIGRLRTLRILAV